MDNIVESFDLIWASEQIIAFQSQITQFIINKSKELKSAKITKSEQNIFSCNFCGRSYPRKSQLGGHISKSHPNQSVQYKQTQLIRKFRESERQRQRYLKSLFI